MKRLLIAIGLCVPLFASAGDLSLSCIGPDTDDCPVVVDVTLEQEKLIASVHIDGKPRTLNWCGGTTFGAPYWSDLECSSLWGTFRVINGNFTKRELAMGRISFEIRRVHTFCNIDYQTSRPVCRPMPR